MNITITKDNLQTGLQTVLSAIGTRSALPILSNVLMSAEKDYLELTASDLDLTITSSVKAQVSEEGKTTLPARRLFQIVKELPNQELKVESGKDDKCKIECGSIKVRLYGLPAADYPQLRSIKEDKRVVLKQDKFKELITKTSFAASQEEGRYLLNGVYMEFQEHNIVVVATDGRRLSLVEEEFDVPENCKGGINIPARIVNEVVRMLKDSGDIEIVIADNFLRFQIMDGENPPTKIYSKLIEGTFPNYRQVVPKESKYRIEINREEFLFALKRAELVTSERQSSVKLNFKENSLTLTTNTPDIGDFSETIAVRFNGENFAIAFNPAYLIEPLSVLKEDTIYFELTDHMSPGVIKINGPFLYVVMPMRLQD